MNIGEVFLNLTANTKDFVSDVNDAVKDASSSFGALTTNISDGMKNAGNQISNVGGSITALTAPITAVGAASVAAWKDVDNGLDIIIQKTGASGEALEEMQDIAKNISTTIPASFEEVGTAVGEVNTRFGLTGDELQEVSEQFIKFAQLNGTDVNSSIDSVQAAMAAFGLETQDTGDVLDILNKAGQDTGVSMDVLSNTLLQNSTALQEMGLGLNTGAGLIANLEKNGIDTSTAMAGLKKAFANATKDGKSMEEALSELQTNLQNASNDTEAYQQVMELFGNKAGPQLAAAIQEGRLAFDEISLSVRDYGDSVSNTFDETLDPMDKMKTNLNQLKLVGADLVDSAAPLISDVLGKMSEGIQKLSDLWNGLSEEQQQMIIKAAGIAVALGPVLVIGGKLISGIGSLIGLLPTLGSAIGFIASPIGIIVVAIAGLIAYLVHLYNTSEEFRDKTNAAFESVKEVVQEVIQVSIELIRSIIEAVKNFYNENKAYLDMIANAIQVAINGIMGIIKGVMEIIMGILSGDKEKIWNGVQTLMTGLGEFISGALSALAGVLAIFWEEIKKIFQAGKDWILGKWEEIKSYFENFSLVDIGKNIINGLIDGLKSGWDGLKECIGSLGDGIKDGFKNIFNIHSPSRWMRDEIAGNLIKGFDIGINANTKNALNSVEALGGQIQNVLQAETPQIAFLGSEKGRSLVDTASNNITTFNSGTQGENKDLERIENLLLAILNKSSQIVVDDRVLGETVTEWQKNEARRLG